jgi:peptidyl-prolyl cis-trans isomerase A (cyclophilin A)
MKNFILASWLFFLVFTSQVNAQVNVLMSTSQGDITLELYTNEAPVTAGNFLALVDNNNFDGASFYRIVTYENDKGFPLIEVIQGGLGDRAEEFTSIPHETTEQTGIRHTDGVISMARAAVGTASTEFFIILGDQPSLDYSGERNPDQQGFAAFGKVINGMDVVRKIHQLPANGPSDSEYTVGQILTEAVTINSVSRID